jgi:antitoxin Phd
MTATATEVKNRFGAFLDEAQRSPVTVESNSRPRAVLVSYDDYQRLQAMEDYYWNQRAMEAEKSGYVGADVLMALLDAGPDASEE